MSAQHGRTMLAAHQYDLGRNIARILLHVLTGYIVD